MVIFKIDGGPHYKPISWDSIDITFDSTEITWDQTFGESFGYKMVIQPRFYTSQFKIELKREVRDEIFEIVNPFSIFYNGDMTILFDHDFEEGQNYEIKVIDSLGRLMWRGKGYATSQNDLENYTLNPKNNGKIVI